MRCFRHYEPSLSELMADDLLGLILARQGLTPGRFERMMLDMADRLRGESMVVDLDISAMEELSQVGRCAWD